MASLGPDQTEMRPEANGQQVPDGLPGARLHRHGCPAAPRGQRDAPAGCCSRSEPHELYGCVVGHVDPST